MTGTTGKLRLIAATASVIVLSGMAVPANAGALGSVTGGVSGAVGAAVGGLGGSSGGDGGSGGGVASAGVAADGGGSTGIQANTGVSTTKGTKAWLRLKASGVKGTKAHTNANLLAAKDGLNANAQADLNSATRLKAKIGANALGKNGQSLAGNASVLLGGPAALKAKAGADAGTGGANGAVSLSALAAPARLSSKAGVDASTSAANASASLSLGLSNGGVGNGGAPGTGSGPGSGAGQGNNVNNGNNAGIRREIAGLSPSERRQLARKCPSVLSSPASYSADAVRVCRVVGQLAGL